jgi:hypothetical protein
MTRLLFVSIILSSFSLSAQTFYARDFGAKGDGTIDDGPAIQKAINAISLANGQKTLVFDPGRNYYIKNINGTYLFNLKGMSDITVDGENAVFLLAGNVRFMCLESSENMTIQNLSVDYRPLPFAEGIVIAKNKHERYLDVKINDDFEMPPLGGPTHNLNEQAYFAMLWNKGPYALLGTHYWVENIIKAKPDNAAKRIVRVVAGANFTDWKIIQPHVTKISIPVRGIAHIGPNEVVRIMECEDVYFNNINIWSAPWFAIGVTRNRGNVEFKNVNICPKPGTDRITSSWRDGFHVSSNYARLLWENCLIKGTNDDAFNISSFASSVLSVNADESITIKQDYPLNIVPYEVGDIVKIYDVLNGRFLGKAKVKSSKGFVQTGVPKAPEIRLVLDRPIEDIHAGCQLWNESSANPKTTLFHCEIYNSCRFQSAIIIDSCEIKALSWFYGDNTEGPIPSNILIKNSKLFLGRGNPTSVVVFSGNMTSNGVLIAPKEPVISNVVLENNVIDGALRIAYADNVSLLGNKFLLPRSGIFLKDTRHVSLKGNSLGAKKISALSQLHFMDDSSAASTVIWPDNHNDPSWAQPDNTDIKKSRNAYYRWGMSDFDRVKPRQKRFLTDDGFLGNGCLQKDRGGNDYLVNKDSIRYYGMAKWRQPPLWRVPKSIHDISMSLIKVDNRNFQAPNWGSIKW